ncbi:MAG: hypothetical protein AMXMBFR82_43190 [Candidatus Hydrogenedentota bacterium]
MTRHALDRRSFLKQSAATVAAASAFPLAANAIPQHGAYAPADADKYDFLMARICNNNPDWDFGPGGDKNFLEQLSHVLRVKVKLQPNVRDEYPSNGLPEHFNALVDLGSIEAMRQFPMLFMMGTGSFRIGQPQLDVLKEYICCGGFVLMDECASPRRADDFYQSSYLALVSMFGQEAVRPIPEDHEVYRNVYDISRPNFQRWQRPGGASPGNVGLFVGDRLAAVLCDSDIHCGWTDPRDSWGKRAYHEEGIKTGINIVAYFLSH